MTHNEVYKHFPYWLLNFTPDDVDSYFGAGRNTIRIRFKSVLKPDLIFKFNSNKDWSIETVESFISKMPKGDNKNV